MRTILNVTIPLIFGILLLTNCTQKSTNNEQNDISTNENVDDFTKYENANYIAYIDERESTMAQIQSLGWEKQTTEYGAVRMQLEAYLDDAGNPVKIIEYFHDGEAQPEGRRTYYLKDNQLVAFTEEKEVWVDDYNTKYVEKRTVYENGNSVLTQERSSIDYESIQDSTWKNIALETQTLDKIEQILAGTGPFETHFISVVQGEQLFLVLGENKSDQIDRYTTAVLVEEETPFITDLLKNLDTYKFRPVNISFKVIGGNNQPEFRVLTDISWKE